MHENGASIPSSSRVSKIDFPERTAMVLRPIGKHDFELTGLVDNLRIGEMLDVALGGRASGGRHFEGRQHAVGAAAVEMGFLGSCQ